MKLLFVYNANSGFVSTMLDGAHKIISPGTYKCCLCKLTFGNFSEKDAWKQFRESSGIEMQFLHRDEFADLPVSRNFRGLQFPVVLLESEGETDVLINSEELNEMKEIQELIGLLSERLALR